MISEIAKPKKRPSDPRFSSGPTRKRSGWNFGALANSLLGRSHRSAPARARLKLAIDLTREVLQVPSEFRIAIVAGSDTGAVEMAMWSLLGPLPVTIMAWENFGKDWVIDAAEQLKLNPTIMVTPYGMLPKLSEVDTQTNDVVFTWNGTAAGVRVPNGDWIDSNRQGLTICDATSAAFAQALDWSKLDVVTYSWQKVLGGEAAHGMLLLGPRAVERLESYQPAWPMPKLFRMTENGVLTEGLFQGETINTPSMLAVEDYIDALNWVRSNGGLATMQARSNDSLKHIEEWAERTTWVDFLAVDPLSRSNTGVCLRIADPRVANLPLQDQARVTQAIASLLDKEGVAYDIASYKTAPPGLRIWCGGTVDPTDVKALTPWLDWAFETVMAQH